MAAVDFERKVCGNAAAFRTHQGCHVTPKEEWLRYSGWISGDDAWLRDRIASLFDIKKPNGAQQRLLDMASLRLTLMDLPSAGYADHERELKALAEAEFGLPPVEDGSGGRL